MSAEQKLNGLTEDQKKEVLEAYLLEDKASYSEEELAIARKMFDTPEKFAILRKIFQVLTAEEKGIQMINPQSLIDANLTDLQHYAIETAVNNLADEKVREGLLKFYRLMRGEIQEEMIENFEKQNKEEFEEKQRTEKFDEEVEDAKRTLGPNL